ATMIADLARRALAQANLLRADVLVVGAAGAGRAADAEEIRITLSRERFAGQVVVVSDVMLAFAALGAEVGVVLVAGTGSVAFGRASDGRMVRQGGFGWQMGDEGAGYWIGREALNAMGLAVDGRGPATELLTGVMTTIGAPTVRDAVGWSTVASPREVASLTRAVVSVANAGDTVAADILTRATAHLANLVNSLGKEFVDQTSVPVGLTGGLIGHEGPLHKGVAALIQAPFVPAEQPV
ncbi:MAG: BadF/BadG/BcrA/BcrD ATPase family protein, partial [Gemmatimonadales bacterium]